MRNISKVLLMTMVMGLFIIRPVSSYADWNGHDGHNNGGNSHGNNGGGHGHEGGHGHSFIGVNLSIWPDSYYYGAPYYPYYPYYPADAVLVSPPDEEQPVTVVQSPTVVVDQAGPAAPVITTVGTTSDTGDSFTINIPNNKGGYTAVTLKKSGNGFIGPQGEFYPEFPKVFQLEVIYGK